jgi:hypothetical protein
VATQSVRDTAGGARETDGGPDRCIMCFIFYSNDFQIDSNLN